jgi:hypothetical protein
MSCSNLKIRYMPGGNSYFSLKEHKNTERQKHCFPFILNFWQVLNLRCSNDSCNPPYHIGIYIKHSHSDGPSYRTASLLGSTMRWQFIAPLQLCWHSALHNLSSWCCLHLQFDVLLATVFMVMQKSWQAMCPLPSWIVTENVNLEQFRW